MMYLNFQFYFYNGHKFIERWDDSVVFDHGGRCRDEQVLRVVINGNIRRSLLRQRNMDALAFSFT